MTHPYLIIILDFSTILCGIKNLVDLIRGILAFLLTHHLLSLGMIKYYSNYFPYGLAISFFFIINLVILSNIFFILDWYGTNCTYKWIHKTLRAMSPKPFEYTRKE